jgi:hypothetical protein
MKMQISLMLVIVLMVSNISWADPNDPVYFPDDNFKQCVINELAALGIITSDPNESDMLHLKYLTGNSAGITSLTGIEYALNLEELALEINSISNIEPLSGLTSLEVLFLTYNLITDISALSELTALRHLELTANQITDISALSGLRNLTELVLYDNHISDISPLSELISINHLGLAGNKIVDISPLLGLSNLNHLTLKDNLLSNESYCLLNTIYENNPDMYIQCDRNTNPCNNVSASDGTNAQAVIVQWEPYCFGPYNDNTYYQVYRSLSPDPCTATAICSWQVETDFNDTTAEVDNIYYYWVRASTYNKGNGANLNEYSAYDTGWLGQNNLAQITLSSTPCGSVTEPGEGTFYYESGTEVSLKAEATDPNYNFFRWTDLDAKKVVDIYAPETKVIVDGNSTLMAEFSKWDPNAALSQEQQDAIKDRIQEQIEQDRQKRSEQTAQIRDALKDEYARLASAFKNQPQYSTYKSEYDKILSDYEKSSQTDQDYENAIGAMETLTEQYQYMLDAAIDQAKINLPDVKERVRRILHDYDHVEVTPSLLIVGKNALDDIWRRNDPEDCPPVPPEAPQNVSAEWIKNDEYGTWVEYLSVSWDIVDCATSYQIWCNQYNDANQAVQIGTVDFVYIVGAYPQPRRVYFEKVPSELLDERIYWCWVKAVNANGESDFSEGALTPCIRYIAPSPPQNVRASDGLHYHSVVVRWDPVDCAEGYRIYRTPSLDSATTKYLGYVEHRDDADPYYYRFIDDFEGVPSSLLDGSYKWYYYVESVNSYPYESCEVCYRYGDYGHPRGTVLPPYLRPADDPGFYPPEPDPGVTCDSWTPKDVEVSRGEEVEIKIDWKPVECAVGYEIWRDTDWTYEGRGLVGYKEDPPFVDEPPATPEQKAFLYWIYAMNSEGEHGGGSDGDWGSVVGPMKESYGPPYSFDWNYPWGDHATAETDNGDGSINLYGKSFGLATGDDWSITNPTWCFAQIWKRPDGQSNCSPITSWGETTLKTMTEMEAKCKIIILGDDPSNIPDNVYPHAYASISLIQTDGCDASSSKKICELNVIQPPYPWMWRLEIDTLEYIPQTGDIISYPPSYRTPWATIETEIPQGTDQVSVGLETITEAVTRENLSVSEACVDAKVKYFSFTREE